MIITQNDNNLLNLERLHDWYKHCSDCIVCKYTQTYEQYCETNSHCNLRLAHSTLNAANRKYAS